MSRDSLTSFLIHAQNVSEGEINRLLEGNIIPYDSMELQQSVAQLLDDINNFEVPAVVNQPRILSDRSYCGEFGFDALINTCHGRTAPFVYSEPLKKVFSKLNEKFPVEFKVDEHNEQLFIRATPIYDSIQHVQEPVLRCILHALEKDPTNAGLNKHIWNHVLRCHHPRAIYEGDIDKKERLSVRVPFEKPQPGTSPLQFVYSFVCKNSCESGMNRRPLQIIFTLENQNGNVLGRKAVNARICCCPKRDKDKEEKTYNGTKFSHRGGRKRKFEKKSSLSSVTSSSLSNQECELQFKVIGKENAKAVLKYAHDLMVGEMFRHRCEQPFKNCAHNINQKMKSSNFSSFHSQ